MKVLSAFLVVVFLSMFAIGQGNQAPLAQKEFEYKDWTYKNLNGKGDTNLRKFADGKKLVMVVYWMPWCPDWKRDAPFVQELYQKYGDKGLGVVGVGEYDTLENMRSHVSQFKLEFPMVYESDSREAREQTVHFSQRREAGDLRRWGTPWYIFLEPAQLNPDGGVLAGKVDQVNGELIPEQIEQYIREKLGLNSATASNEIEACEPEKKTVTLTRP